MSGEGDDNLEKFFRKAADQQTTEYSERDWQRMEKMLDEYDAQHVPPFTFRWWPAGLAVLLVGIVATSIWYAAGDKSGVNSELSTLNSDRVDNSADERAHEEGGATASEAIQHDSESSAATTTSQYDKNLRDSEKQTVDNDHIQKDEKGAMLGDNEVNERERSTNISRVGTSASNKQLKKSNTSILENGDSRSSDRSTSNGETASEVESNNDASALRQDSTLAEVSARSNTREVPTLSNVPLNEDDQGEISSPEHEQQITVRDTGDVIESQSLERTLNDRADESEDSTVIAKALTQTVERDSATSFPEEQNNKQSRTRRWNIAFVMAPDFSKTTGSGFADAGEVYGFSVGYSLFDRLTVSVGALRSYKKYWSYGSEYKPPAGYWIAKTNGIIPEKVDGNCVVLEIPLTLAFDIVGTKRSRMFVSAGVSSYLMQSENCSYEFDEPNPGAANGWKSSDRSSFPWSVAGLSVGYEYFLTRGFSIGVEPYYKMPLKKVGWGNVSLYSTGVFLQGRYRF